MRWFRIASLVIVGLLVASAPARADWLARFWHQFRSDTVRSNLWPHPYTAQDVQQTKAFPEVMIVNGWRRQNTIGEHYFENGTSTINQAGREKLWLVLATSPPQHSTVYVARDADARITEERIAAVRSVLEDLVGDGEVPPIAGRVVTHPGAPAEYVDMIGQKFRESTPDPRLPTVTEDGL